MSTVTRRAHQRWAAIGLAVLTHGSAASAQRPPTTAGTTKPARYAAVGEVVADVVTVATTPGGRMVQTSAKVGQPVRRGDLLAAFDSTAATSLLDAAKAEHQAALADLRRAQAQQPTDRPAVEAAINRVQAAQAQIRTAQQALDATGLLAPCDGTVATLGVKPGDVVPAGRAVVQIAKAGPALVSFDVPPGIGQRIGPRTVVQIESVLGTPIAPALGVVTDVSPVAGRPAGTRRVTARLLAVRADLPPGSSVTVTVALDD